MPDNKVQIDFVAENAELKRKLSEAEAGLDAFKKKAEQADATELGFKQSVGAVTSFIGKATAAVGIATGFYEIGARIGNLFRSIAPDTERFQKSIDFQKPAEQLGHLQEKIADLQNANTGGLEGDIGNLIRFQTSAQVREQIKTLEQTRTFESGAAVKERADAEAAVEKQKRDTLLAAAKSNAEAIAAQALAIELSNLDGLEAVDARREADKARIRDLTLKASTQAELDAIQALDSASAGRADREAARIREANDAALAAVKTREAAEIASAKRVADAIADALKKPFEEIARANRSFVDAQTQQLITTIGRLTDSLDALDSIGTGGGATGTSLEGGWSIE